MFTKQEISALKQRFWTNFGQYMAPVPAAGGLKVNWINYKTSVKNLHFKLEAGDESATVGIVLTHADPAQQTIVFNQLKQVRRLLRDAVGEEWQWSLHEKDEHNKTVSRIYTLLPGINISKAEDWPAIISFFKPRIMALDIFWDNVKDGFVE